MLRVILLAAATLAQPVSPLAGPPVARDPGHRSLVKYDFNSRLRRPETSPEHAAVLLLDLPAAERAKADEILARRAALIDGFVAGNLFLLQELDTAGKAGGKLDQFVLLLRTLEKIRPVLEAGPLRDQVASVLPAPEAAKFRAMVNEYWSAAIREGLRDSRAAGKKEARWLIDLGERFKHLAEEIGRSYERQAASGTLFIDSFMADLNLTPEQARTINGLKFDMLERTGMHPGEKDQQQLVVGALAYLNVEQRTKVLKRISGK
jgi:hypothetical protein